MRWRRHAISLGCFRVGLTLRRMGLEHRKLLLRGPRVFSSFDNSGSNVIAIISAHGPDLHIWASPGP